MPPVAPAVAPLSSVPRVFQAVPPHDSPPSVVDTCLAYKELLLRWAAPSGSWLGVDADAALVHDPVCGNPFLNARHVAAGVFDGIAGLGTLTPGPHSPAAEVLR